MWSYVECCKSRVRFLVWVCRCERKDLCVGWWRDLLWGIGFECDRMSGFVSHGCVSWCGCVVVKERSLRRCRIEIVFRSGGVEIYCEVSDSVGNVKVICVVSVSCRIWFNINFIFLTIYIFIKWVSNLELVSDKILVSWLGAAIVWSIVTIIIFLLSSFFCNWIRLNICISFGM